MRKRLRAPLLALMSLVFLVGSAGCGSGQGQGAAQGSKAGHHQAAGMYAGASHGKTGGTGGRSGQSAARAGKHAGQSAAPTAAARTRYHFYFTVLPGTPKAPNSPLFIPANFTLPPESDITIRNVVNGTAPVTQAWSRVTGILGGTEEIAGKKVRSAPPKIVSHTFSVTVLHLNVPIPATSTVSFAFRTPAVGSYRWHCVAPCGTDTGGMQGAMRQSGWMNRHDAHVPHLKASVQSIRCNRRSRAPCGPSADARCDMAGRIGGPLR